MANTNIMSNWLETGRFKETMCDQEGKVARASETLEDSAALPAARSSLLMSRNNIHALPAAQVDPQDELAAAFVSSTPRH